MGLLGGDPEAGPDGRLAQGGRKTQMVAPTQTGWCHPRGGTGGCCRALATVNLT